MLDEILSKIQERSEISITKIRASDDSKVVSGLINAGGKYANANIEIHNVEATLGSKVMLGMAEGVNTNNFF